MEIVLYRDLLQTTEPKSIRKISLKNKKIIDKPMNNDSINLGAYVPAVAVKAINNEKKLNTLSVIIWFIRYLQCTHMLTHWKKIKQLLLKKDRKRLAWLLLPMSVTALVNVFGIALIMPFLSVVSDPSIIQANANLLWFYGALNFQDVHQFTIALGGLALTMLIITNAFAAFTIWLSSQVVADVRARISQSLYEKYLDKPYEFHLNHNSTTLVNNLFQLTAQFTNGFILQGMMLVTNVITIFAITCLVVVIDPVMAMMTVLLMGGYLGRFLFY